MKVVSLLIKYLCNKNWVFFDGVWIQLFNRSNHYNVIQLKSIDIKKIRSVYFTVHNIGSINHNCFANRDAFFYSPRRDSALSLFHFVSIFNFEEQIDVYHVVSLVFNTCTMNIIENVVAERRNYVAFLLLLLGFGYRYCNSIVCV